MLLCLPRKYHSDDEDYAPIDYSYVGSVAEGKRCQQGAHIHQTPDQANVRHRAAPKAEETNDAQEPAQSPATGQPRGYESAKHLPQSGNPAANAARIAYPRARDNAFADSPAYAPQRAPSLTDAAKTAHYGAAQAPVSRRPERIPPAQSTAQADDDYIQPPTEASTPPEEIPDWLRMARQNNLHQGMERAQRIPRNLPTAEPPDAPPPTDLLGRPIARREPPKNQHPTPISAEEYAQAGYPEELIALHRQEEDALHTALGIGRKRHGAQLAAPPAKRQTHAPQEGGRNRTMHSNHDPFAANDARQPRSTMPDEATPNFAPDTAGTYEPYPQQEASGPYDPQSGSWEMDGYPQQGANQPPRFAPRTGRAPRTRYQPEDAYAQGTDSYPSFPEETNDAMLASSQADEETLPPQGRNARFTPYEDAYGAQPMDPYAPKQRYAPTQSGYDPRLQTPQAENGRRNPYYALNGMPLNGEDEWPDDLPPEEETEKPKLSIPYLGIATFVAALALVVLWILQGSFARQTQEVYTARAATQAQLVDNHPYRYRELIESEAAKNNLHPAFVAAIVLNESSFDPNAESSVGARGLMQMMPDTSQWVFDKIGDTGEYNFDMMYDPDTNVRYACWYLSYLSERFRGDPVLVSAAFHAGQTTVQNWLNNSRYSQDSQTIDLEDMMDGPTKTYATRVNRAFATYRRLYYEGGLEQISGEAAQASTAVSAGITNPA